MKFNKSGKPEINLTKNRRKSEFGFSLLELMVAMVIFLIVTGSIYGLLRVGRIDRNRASRRSDIMKNARTAVHLMGRDALNAGLSYHKKGGSVPDNFLSNRFGLPVDTDTEREFATSIVVGNDLFPNDLLNDANARTDSVTFAWRDLDFNKPPAPAPPAEDNGVGIIVQLSGVSNKSNAVRVTAAVGNSLAAANQYDLFMIQAGSNQVLVMKTDAPNSNTATFAATDPLGINQTYNGSADNRSLLRPCAAAGEEDCTTYPTNIFLKRVRLVTYKVKTDGTLVRLEYGNNVGRPADEQIQEQPLAYNVKDLQIRYLLTDGRVTDNPAAGKDDILGTADDQIKDSNLITQMTITIKVAATEADEQTGKAEVVTLNATFSTRNLQYKYR